MSSTWMRLKTCPGLTMRRASPLRDLDERVAARAVDPGKAQDRDCDATARAEILPRPLGIKALAAARRSRSRRRVSRRPIHRRDRRRRRPSTDKRSCAGGLACASASPKAASTGSPFSFGGIETSAQSASPMALFTSGFAKSAVEGERVSRPPRCAFSTAARSAPRTVPTMRVKPSPNCRRSDPPNSRARSKQASTWSHHGRVGLIPRRTAVPFGSDVQDRFRRRSRFAARGREPRTIEPAQRPDGGAAHERRSISRAAARHRGTSVGVARVADRDQHIAQKAGAADALDRALGEQRAEAGIIKAGQFGERRRAQRGARRKLRLAAGAREFVPGADRQAIVAAVDAVAHQRPQLARDRALVLDGEIGDAAPRIEPIRRRESAGRADVEAARDTNRNGRRPVGRAAARAW